MKTTGSQFHDTHLRNGRTDLTKFGYIKRSSFIICKFHGF